MGEGLNEPGTTAQKRKPPAEDRRAAFDRFLFGASCGIPCPDARHSALTGSRL